MKNINPQLTVALRVLANLCPEWKDVPKTDEGYIDEKTYRFKSTSELFRKVYLEKVNPIMMMLPGIECDYIIDSEFDEDLFHKTGDGELATTYIYELVIYPDRMCP